MKNPEFIPSPRTLEIREEIIRSYFDQHAATANEDGAVTMLRVDRIHCNKQGLLFSFYRMAKKGLIAIKKVVPSDGEIASMDGHPRTRYDVTFKVLGDAYRE